MNFLFIVVRVLEFIFVLFILFYTYIYIVYTT